MQQVRAFEVPGVYIEGKFKTVPTPKFEIAFDLHITK